MYYRKYENFLDDMTDDVNEDGFDESDVCNDNKNEEFGWSDFCVVLCLSIMLYINMN